MQELAKPVVSRMHCAKCLEMVYIVSTLNMGAYMVSTGIMDVGEASRSLPSCAKNGNLNLNAKNNNQLAFAA
jgi:hypothetical protein